MFARVTVLTCDIRVLCCQASGIIMSMECAMSRPQRVSSSRTESKEPESEVSSSTMGSIYRGGGMQAVRFRIALLYQAVLLETNAWAGNV